MDLLAIFRGRRMRRWLTTTTNGRIHHSPNLTLTFELNPDFNLTLT